MSKKHILSISVYDKCSTKKDGKIFFLRYVQLLIKRRGFIQVHHFGYLSNIVFKDEEILIIMKCHYVDCL